MPSLLVFRELATPIALILAVVGLTLQIRSVRRSLDRALGRISELERRVDWLVEGVDELRKEVVDRRKVGA